MFGLNLEEPPLPDKIISEDTELRLGNSELIFLFTPGHTPGEFCIYLKEEKICVTGDVLFKEGIGRTDLWGGNYDTLIKSIETQLFSLHDDVEIKAGIFNEEMTEFVIVDKGSGISDSNRDKLFNIGKIFSTEGTKGEKGSGLGLALAKQIIDKHKGDIWFYSNKGEGSEFHFTVPSSQNSILLVLASEEERVIVSKIISEHFRSFKILSALNGFEALSIISAKMPSLVVADHNLPLMDGVQFVQSVRKENKNLRIPFIVLINSEGEEITKSYQEIGIKTFKKLSFDPDLLVEKIESLLFN